ncbi:MAG: hypothetical protein J6Y82_01230 [Bacteroidales bacterium]|nr:hypothetical protein [Bacteroidales bacterium]
MDEHTRNEYVSKFQSEMLEIVSNAVKRVNNFSSASTFVSDVDAMQADMDKQIDELTKRYTAIPGLEDAMKDSNIMDQMELHLAPAMQALSEALNEKTKELVGGDD